MLNVSVSVGVKRNAHITKILTKSGLQVPPKKVEGPRNDDITKILTTSGLQAPNKKIGGQHDPKKINSFRVGFWSVWGPATLLGGVCLQPRIYIIWGLQPFLVGLQPRFYQ